ncbi:anti-sigma-K factor rskA [Maribacter vaceletii]|uniref:Regulator of SigK n=1 Tax=Maribacter vaceletii TaxID=1206816 RepID=A0A495DTN6_9FLAO|nr:anti-sigma factor [Maribacter vaceletii]RKR07940.1 anti-sigma-K factor rskA [Maribacter vaceletii]
MNVKEYIESGILELYVAGQLSEDENLKVAEHASLYPDVQKEIIAIEASILALSKTAAPKMPLDFAKVYDKIKNLNSFKVVPLKENKTNWTSYMGWAASILLIIGGAYLYNQNEKLQSQIEVVEGQRINLEEQISDAKTSLAKSEDLLSTIRDKNITVIPLGGQEVSPTSYAKVYWNKKEEKLYIDAQGLPEPPDGMVYQVWSLKLNPLTPTSVGLLEDFIEDDNRIFNLTNANASEAFGITLEPAGGSKSPNLEQLYTLGVVSSS